MINVQEGGKQRVEGERRRLRYGAISAAAAAYTHYRLIKEAKSLQGG